jgi:hypothetical protein
MACTCLYDATRTALLSWKFQAKPEMNPKKTVRTMSQKQMQNHKFFEGQKHALLSWASCSTNEVSSISDGAMLDIGNMTWLFANAAV